MEQEPASVFDTKAINHFFNDLMHLSSLVANVRGKMADSLGLNASQLYILFYLANEEAKDGAPVGQVARFLRVTGSMVTTQVSTLYKLGYVDKRPNPTDKRSVLLSLTSEGARILADFSPLRTQLNNSLFEGMSEVDFNNLCASLRQLNNNWDRTQYLLPQLFPNKPTDH